METLDFEYPSPGIEVDCDPPAGGGGEVGFGRRVGGRVGRRVGVITLVGDTGVVGVSEGTPSGAPVGVSSGSCFARDRRVIGPDRRSERKINGVIAIARRGKKKRTEIS